MLCAVLSHSIVSDGDLMDYSPPGFSVHGDSPGKNTGVGCHALLKGTFPTHRSNPGFPHCRRILYCLSHQGSLRILEWVAMPSSRRSSQARDQNPGLPHCRQILYHLSQQGSPRILAGVGSLFLLQQMFLTQESNWGFLHCRQILYQLSY